MTTLLLHSYSSTAKVDKTTFSQQDDVASTWHQESINLGLDVDLLGAIGLEPGNIYFNVKVTNTLMMMMILGSKVFS